MVEALGYYQDFTDRGRGLWEALKAHYEADPGLEQAHVNVLQQQLALRFPRQADDYAAYIADLDPSPPVENLTDVLIRGRRDALARDMAITLVEGSYGAFETLLSDFRATEELSLTSDTLVGTEL